MVAAFGGLDGPAVDGLIIGGDVGAIHRNDQRRVFLRNAGVQCIGHTIGVGHGDHHGVRFRDVGPFDLLPGVGAFSCENGERNHGEDHGQHQNRTEQSPAVCSFHNETSFVLFHIACDAGYVPMGPNRDSSSRYAPFIPNCSGYLPSQMSIVTKIFPPLPRAKLLNITNHLQHTFPSSVFVYFPVKSWLSLIISYFLISCQQTIVPIFPFESYDSPFSCSAKAEIFVKHSESTKGAAPWDCAVF